MASTIAEQLYGFSTNKPWSGTSRSANRLRPDVRTSRMSGRRSKRRGTLPERLHGILGDVVAEFVLAQHDGDAVRAEDLACGVAKDRSDGIQGARTGQTFACRDQLEQSTFGALRMLDDPDPTTARSVAGQPYVSGIESGGDRADRPWRSSP